MGILKKISWKGKINRSLRSCVAQANYLCKSYAEVRLDTDLTREERVALWMDASEATNELVKKLGKVMEELVDYACSYDDMHALGMLSDVGDIIKLMSHEQEIAMNSVLNAG